MNEAELLFTQILNCTRASLYLDKEIPFDKRSSALAAAVLKRRMRGEPLQYILGKAEFMGLEFKLTPDVLIPRPETEVLVEAAIRYAQGLAVEDRSILDLGTGCGCIAVSLAKFLPGVRITAADISRGALNIARENSRINGVEGRIMFLESDLFASLPVSGLPYGICVCNPPYIADSKIGMLQPELQYEPRIALDGGRDGLNFYRRVVYGVAGYLKKDGFLIMEMGFDQAEPVKNIFQKSGYFEIIESIKDYNRFDRVIIAKKRGNG